ncbi:hypothetical protein HK405_003986 [Cladochytrium tenue]|nr:hypothetical protein HK405_003986 [Cladochytrium tenue]
MPDYAFQLPSPTADVPPASSLTPFVAAAAAAPTPSPPPPFGFGQSLASVLAHHAPTGVVDPSSSVDIDMAESSSSSAIRADTPFYEPKHLEIHHKVLMHAFNMKPFGTAHHLVVDAATSPTGMRILGLGAHGGWTQEIARLFPNCTVVGLEVGPTVIPPENRTANLSISQAVMDQPLPFPENYFDFVFIYEFLSFLPAQSWTAFLNDVKRVTRPAGIVQFLELYPVAQRGGPSVKRLNDLSLRLDILLEDSGLKDVIEETRSAPLGWNGEIGEMALNDLLSSYAKVRPLLQAAGKLGDDEYCQLVASYRDECVSNQAYVNFFLACGRVDK